MQPPSLKPLSQVGRPVYTIFSHTSSVGSDALSLMQPHKAIMKSARWDAFTPHCISVLLSHLILPSANPYRSPLHPLMQLAHAACLDTPHSPSHSSLHCCLQWTGCLWMAPRPPSPPCSRPTWQAYRSVLSLGGALLQTPAFGDMGWGSWDGVWGCGVWGGILG